MECRVINFLKTLNLVIHLKTIEDNDLAAPSRFLPYTGF